MKLANCLHPIRTLALGALLAGALAAQPGSFREIAPGVWFRHGDPAQGHCNNLVVAMKEWLLVVDANFPSGAEAVMADISKTRQLSGKPVRWVFITHHHGDHSYGAAVWEKRGAKILSHAGVVEEMREKEPARWQETAARREDVRTLNLPGPALPSQTFTLSPNRLTDGDRVIEFYNFGWGHTKGDGFVYLPRERILATGDAVANGPFNGTRDANFANWPKTLRALQKFDIDKVAPGHGPLAGPEVIEGQLQFLIELRQEVEQAFGENRRLQLEDIVTLTDGQPTATRLRLPKHVEHWVGPRLPAQVADMYPQVREEVEQRLRAIERARARSR